MQSTTVIRQSARPVSKKAVVSTRTLRCQAENKTRQANVITPTVVAAATAVVASPEFAQAANQVTELSRGEPTLVVIGWGAICVSFTMGIALTIWGRSGF